MSKHGRQGPRNQTPARTNPAAPPSAISETQVHVQRTSYRALPVPDELEAYKTMDPELYAGIRDEFMANGVHRRKMEAEESARLSVIVRQATATEKHSLYGTLIFAFCALAVGTVAIFTGHSVGAVVAIIGVLPGVMAVIRGTGKGKPE